MSELALRIPDGNGGLISALRNAPAGGGPDDVFIYAPGAGSNLLDSFGLYLAEHLPAAGIACMRFQFPYMEKGRSIPDRNELLEATWTSVIETARRDARRLFVGGRSMGGRIASQVVAKGVPVDGLALFAYPLHPTGRPEQRRDQHLASLTAPVLFCSGDRDSFASLDELSALQEATANSRLHILRGADHGFAVLKASGRQREDVWADALGALLAFLTDVPPVRRT